MSTTQNNHTLTENRARILNVILHCESELATNFSLTSRAIITHHAELLAMSPAGFENLFMQQVRRTRYDFARLNPLQEVCR